MGKHPHPDLYYGIYYRNGLYQSKSINPSVLSNEDDLLFIVKTQFMYTGGSDYTYSKHKIFDLELKPTALKIGNVVSESEIVEHCRISHRATIEPCIVDPLNCKKIVSFHHNNGLGNYYSDIYGQGIFSICDLLNLMKQINNWGSWSAYDRFENYQSIVFAKLYHHLSDDIDFINSIVEVPKYRSHIDIIHKYTLNSFKEFGLDNNSRKIKLLREFDVARKKS